MSLKVIGAGLGRTGTNSLKLALEQLLGGPCYHMYELVNVHEEHVPIWHEAAEGKPVDWDALLEGYKAAVDWPACAFWRQLSEKYPEAIVLHSRRDPDAWWTSASETIFPRIRVNEHRDPAWYGMLMAVFGSHFTTELENKETCIEAFHRHEAEVLATVDPKRLVVWEAGDGWEPLCKALNLPVPNEPFQKVNTKQEFQDRVAKREAELEAEAAT